MYRSRHASIACACCAYSAASSAVSAVPVTCVDFRFCTAAVVSECWNLPSLTSAMRLEDARPSEEVRLRENHAGCIDRHFNGLLAFLDNASVRSGHKHVSSREVKVQSLPSCAREVIVCRLSAPRPIRIGAKCDSAADDEMRHNPL